MSETNASTMARPPRMRHSFKRVAILFAGGPAPGANAVISTAATAFLRNEIEVVGVLHGYSHLVDYSPERPLVEGRDYVMVNHRMLGRTRNSQGIIIGTARANPGKDVSHPTHLDDPARVKPLKTVYEALRSIGVDALISIGGDDTLKTANKFKLYQEKLPADAPRIPVVHLPKTIDNDYRGIDFTFGYFTAVDFLGREVRNLIADAEANRAYFLVESMGRSAGWLAYGVAIAGEASLVISVEDIEGPYETTEDCTHPKTRQKSKRKVMDVDKVIKRIVLTMTTREREGKEYGVIVIAEGLASDATSTDTSASPQ
jgi:6-phosphofructokinase